MCVAGRSPAGFARWRGAKRSTGPGQSLPGKLGVVEPDAYADLLVVADDPLLDVNMLAAPDKNLVLIMKDGKIHKDIRSTA